MTKITTSLLLLLGTSISLFSESDSVRSKSIIKGPYGTLTKTTTISESGARSDFSNFSSSSSFNRSPIVDSKDPFPEPDIDQQIEETKQKLQKLYFIRDICPHLQSDIRIQMSGSSLKEILAEFSRVKSTPIQFDLPEIEFFLDTVDVRHMAGDAFLDGIAKASGLSVEYAESSIRFTQSNPKVTERRI